MTDVLQPTDVALADERAGRFRIRGWWIAVIVGIIALQILVTSPTVPALWDTYISGPVDQFSAWLRENRQIHPVFTGFFIPLSAAVDWGLTTVESFLKWLPWFVLPLAVFLVIFRTGDWKMAMVATAAMLYPGLVGLWETTMETLSLMTIAVLIALAIGIPLGVWAARLPRVDRAIRPVLDAMQTIPAPVYFIPIVLLFGIRRVPATIATVIYSLPPAVRLTTLGIQGVPRQSVEAAEMYGSTGR
ncbi:MAG TPA: ABC transporter permease subunit, partial [Acidimicrobiia bacterium]|nr:ABC transporter permease subunit [Acidimicrobiia bacterium]